MLDVQPGHALVHRTRHRAHCTTPAAARAASYCAALPVRLFGLAAAARGLRASHVAPGIGGRLGIRNLPQRILVGLLGDLILLDLLGRLALQFREDVDVRHLGMGDTGQQQARRGSAPRHNSQQQRAARRASKPAWSDQPSIFPYKRSDRQDFGDWSSRPRSVRTWCSLEHQQDRDKSETDHRTLDHDAPRRSDHRAAMQAFSSHRELMPRNQRRGMTSDSVSGTGRRATRRGRGAICRESSRPR